ncbi:hypothetical protein [uncultured Paraglaciecola sp.]|uniref:hypothetical protein n=1 Tax=uncultured Paraglaciecola sp. TaxID=1765024 RepID=UPI0030DC41B1|tara:strand:- start:20152 stop:20418 length:267 start_codon:yes stop_codon:yes gene_type:complete
MIKHWKVIGRSSVIVSVLACFGVSITVTILEWIENPNSIFHSASGTNWSFVTDTFLSWFWPLLMVALPISVVLSIMWFKLKNTKTASN